MNYLNIDQLAKESEYYSYVAHVAYGMIEGNDTLEEALNWAKESYYEIFEVTESEILASEKKTQTNLINDVTIYVNTFKAN
jgi:hypothetical protein